VFEGGGEVYWLGEIETKIDVGEGEREVVYREIKFWTKREVGESGREFIHWLVKTTNINAIMCKCEVGERWWEMIYSLIKHSTKSEMEKRGREVVNTRIGIWCDGE
jgi:hypothetical protein